MKRILLMVCLVGKGMAQPERPVEPANTGKLPPVMTDMLVDLKSRALTQISTTPIVGYDRTKYGMLSYPASFDSTDVVDQAGSPLYRLESVNLNRVDTDSRKNMALIRAYAALHSAVKQGKPTAAIQSKIDQLVGP